jgi:hypothetical protein
MSVRLFSLAILLTGIATAQTSPPPAAPPAAAQPARQPAGKKHSSAGHDIGSGAGDIGKGAAKAALDLVTLHPINAATDLGKGAAGAGRNAGTGAVKGSGKVLKGTAKALRHLF